MPSSTSQPVILVSEDGQVGGRIGYMEAIAFVARTSRPKIISEEGTWRHGRSHTQQGFSLDSTYQIASELLSAECLTRLPVETV